MKFMLDLCCVPKLMRQNQDTQGNKKAEEDKHATDVRPNINCFVVARVQAFADATNWVVVYAIATQYVSIIDLIFVSLLSWADVCSYAKSHLRVLLAYLVRDVRCNFLDRLSLLHYGCLESMLTLALCIRQLLNLKRRHRWAPWRIESFEGVGPPCIGLYPIRLYIFVLLNLFLKRLHLRFAIND